MKKVSLFIVSLHLMANCSLFAQNDDWQQRGSSFAKLDNNIYYVIDSLMNISIRNEIVDKTKMYIQQDLKLLNEYEFCNPLAIICLSNRGEMHKLFGKKVSSFTILKDSINSLSQVIFIYDQNHCPLIKN